MIRQIGIRYVTIGEIELRRTNKETGERLHENSRLWVTAVKEDA